MPNTAVSLDLVVADIQARAKAWRDQEIAEIHAGCLQCSREARIRAAVLEQLATDYADTSAHLTRVA